VNQELGGGARKREKQGKKQTENGLGRQHQLGIHLGGLTTRPLSKKKKKKKKKVEDGGLTGRRGQRVQKKKKKKKQQKKRGVAKKKK